MYTINYSLVKDTGEELLYEVLVDVSRYENVKGNPNTYDSDMDYYGYIDLDWDIVRVTCTNEDGGEWIVDDIDSELNDEQIELFNEYVTDKLIELIEEEIRDYE
jgi:hypothetical protein